MKIDFPIHARARLGKRRGQVAELAFMHKAADLGFAVTKPYGELEPYDFILDSGSRLWRVQVKSTSSTAHRRNRYYVQPSHYNGIYGRQIYTAAEIDFLVAYVMPREAWYVIPVAALATHINLYFYPDAPNSRAYFERYRDAWCLMACHRDGPPRAELSVVRRCDSCPSPLPSP